jgi:hypothetical protein
MKFRLRLAAGLAALLAATLMVGPVQGQAAPTLPPDFYQIDTPLGVEQQRTVETYVNHYIGQLIDGADADVVEARAQLTGPLAKGGTGPFNEQYSAIAARLLEESAVMEPEPGPGPEDAEGDIAARNGAVRVIVRLNAMIVTSRLIKDEHVMSLILKGIADENPAVRYWAVRAARGGVGVVRADQKQQLTAALQQRVNVEQVDEVVRQFLLALIDLDAVDVVASALNELIRLHGGEPTRAYDAKRQAMHALHQKLLVMDAQGQAVEPAIRQLARAAGRYMLLITEQAQGAALNNAQSGDQAETVRLCDVVLRQARQHLGSAANVPAPIDGQVFRRNWPALHAVALEWREVLAQSPFNFSEADLATQ